MRILLFPYRRSKEAAMALALITLALSPSTVMSAPSGGVVTRGQASIEHSGSVTNINQSSQKASINWNSFSVAPKETVNFNQPNSSAMTLNRVVGNERSVIEGAINANGKVFLVNSNGVLFSKSSKVNVGGLVAGTLDISDDDFHSGNYKFKGQGGSVINQGAIKTTDGGYVALLGGEVVNEGIIAAKMGTVSMNGGKKVSLNFNGDSLINASIDEGALNALVENKKAIIADGGRVIMTAKAAGDLMSAQVNNSGLVRARTLGDLKGNININAYGGKTKIAGKLDASAPKKGDGGFIETSGDKVQIADDAVITTRSETGKTGTWLVDPDGFTIGAGGDITGTALSNQLANNNVILESTSGRGNDGNINVNQAVNWAADTVLTLTATNDININASITATGANAGLEMNFGGDYNILTPASYSGTALDKNGKPIANQAPNGVQYASVTLSGSGASLKINGDSYTLIHSMTDLAGINGATGKYALAQDLDASGQTFTGAVVSQLAANSIFAGMGHTIDKITINTTSSGVGLFGQAAGDNVIRDIGLTNVDISTTSSMAGGLVGNVMPGAGRSVINNVYVTGDVYAKTGSAGGLIGRIYKTDVSNAFMSGTVSGGGTLGGLVGAIYQDGAIRNSHANVTMNTIHQSANQWMTQSVTSVGGLVGLAYTGSVISDSYAAGSITAQDGASLGGLVGSLQNSSLNNSFASVAINNHEMGGSSGVKNVGGLVGEHKSGGTIDNVWADGDIMVTVNPSKPNASAQNIGGLVGSSTDGVITNASASGNVTVEGSSMTMGGLVGYNTSTISNSHATGNVSGYTQAGGFVGSNSGQIYNSTASGNVEIRQSIGISQAGGFAGRNAGVLSNVHASGNVNGFLNVGGLAGLNTDTGTISDSSSSGQVSGMDDKNIGGLVGDNRGSLDNNYWNVDSSGQDNAAGVDTGAIVGGEGLTNEQFNDVEYYIDGTIDQVLAQRELARLEQIRRDNLRFQTAMVTGTIPTTSAYFSEHVTEEEISAAAASEYVALDEYLPAEEEKSAAVGVASAGLSKETLGYSAPAAPARSGGARPAARQARPQSFSADVKTIGTDDGPSYELESGSE